MRRTDAAQEQWNRSKPLVRIRLHATAVLQHGNGAVAQKIVQVVERTADDPRRVFPGRSLFQDRLPKANQQERMMEVRVRQVAQQVAMKLAIRRHEMIECERDRRIGLRAVVKDRRLGMQLLEGLFENARQLGPAESRDQLVDQPLKRGVRPAAGKIQVAQHLAGGGEVLSAKFQRPCSRRKDGIARGIPTTTAASKRKRRNAPKIRQAV